MTLARPEIPDNSYWSHSLETELEVSLFHERPPSEEVCSREKIAPWGGLVLFSLQCAFQGLLPPSSAPERQSSGSPKVGEEIENLTAEGRKEGELLDHGAKNECVREQGFVRH